MNREYIDYKYEWEVACERLANRDAWIEDLESQLAESEERNRELKGELVGLLDEVDDLRMALEQAERNAERSERDRWGGRG
jgi:chromosome segregation ATPase